VQTALLAALSLAITRTQYSLAQYSANDLLNIIWMLPKTVQTNNPRSITFIDLNKGQQGMDSEQGKRPTIFLIEEDDEGTEAKVSDNDWVFYLGEEPDQLQNFLNSLLPTPRAE
jgi:hypothetical protein